MRGMTPPFKRKSILAAGGDVVMRAMMRDYLTLGSIMGVVTQMRPPVQSDFGGGGPQSPIYVNGTTGECFIYVNGTITPINTLNVKSFGAKGDGVTDDTAAFNAACAYVNAQDPTVPITLNIPPGTYITSAINNFTLLTRGNIAILGYGAKLMVNGGTNRGGFVWFSGQLMSNIVVAGLHISSTSRSSIGLGLQNCNGVSLHDLVIENSLTGIFAQSFNYYFVTNTSIANCTTGVQLFTGNSFFMDNCHIDGGGAGAYNPGTIGVDFQNTSGVFIGNTDITQCEKGLNLTPTAGNNSLWTILHTVLTDTCNYGVYMKPSGGAGVWGFFAAHCWFSSNQVDGVHAEGPNVIGIYITAATNIFLNGAWGINASAIRDFHVSDCSIVDNNGLNVSAGGVQFTDGTGIYISANHFLNDASGWGPGVFVRRQNTGINLAGSPDDIHIINNVFRGQATADISLGYGAFPSIGVIQGNTTDRTYVIASAATIAPDPVFDVIHLSGTTTVQNISTQGFPHRQLRIVTDAACTVQSTFNFQLAGGVNFPGTAGSCLTVMWNKATGKYGEVSRAIL